jgi:hypothetical protein
VKNVKIKGGSTGSVSRLKKDFEKSSGGKTWIKGLQAGKDLTVRFKTEPDEWFAYREHYDPDRRFYPCIGKDNECPGCEHPSEKVQRTSRRYLADALDTQTGQSIPLKLPLDLANRLVARYERYGGTIRDRDYTLHRMGQALDTTYDVTPEEKSSLDTSTLDPIDLEKALVDQFEDAFDLEGDADDGAKSATKPSDLDTSSDEDDEVPSEPSESTTEDDADGEGWLTEAQALQMSKEDLKELAERLEIETWDGRWSKEKMVETIFAQAG